MTTRLVNDREKVLWSIIGLHFGRGCRQGSPDGGQNIGKQWKEEVDDGVISPYTKEDNQTGKCHG